MRSPLPARRPSTTGRAPRPTRHQTRRPSTALADALSATARVAFGFTLAFTVGLIGMGEAQAQTPAYPSGPVTLVVPFAAGSGTDSVARVVAKGLGEQLGQAVVVENRAGGSAQVAAQLVAGAKPDGQTLMMTTNTAHSANPALFVRLPYDAIKDFTAITRVGELPFLVVVNNDLPIRSMGELIAYAKAQPGRLSYATPNSTSLVASETLERLAGIDLLAVPYKSSPQAMTDVIAGTVSLSFADLGTASPMVKAGKVRALATANANGSRNFPDLPSVGKAVPGFDLTSWNGIVGPAGLPRPVVERLNTAILAVLADKAVQDQLVQIGFEVWPSRTPDEFHRYMVEQLEYWTSLIKAAAIPRQ